MKNRKVGKITAIVLCVAAGLLWFTHTSIANNNTYKIRPEVSVGGYQSDAARITDAYERLMDRYMDMVEKNMVVNSAKLDSIDKRLSRIEKALNIRQGKP